MRGERDAKGGRASRPVPILRIGRVLGDTITFKRTFIPQIIKKTKTLTIRWGIVRPTKKVVLIESEGALYGKAEIKRVVVTQFSRIDEASASKDGFRSLEELKAALKRIYPSIAPDDPVTLLEFEVKECFSRPIPKDLLFTKAAKLARVALAHGLYTSASERQALARIAAGEAVVDAATVAGVPVERIATLLLKAQELEAGSS